jgi:hypothetical protein
LAARKLKGYQNWPGSVWPATVFTLNLPAVLKFAGSSRTHINHVGSAMKLRAATRIMMLQVLTSDLLPLDTVLTWNIPKNIADPAS